MTSLQTHESERPSVLVVDDDAIFSSTLARALNDRGYAVTVCGSRAEGLQSIDSDSPEFGVVDLRLPDGSGLCLVQALKAADPETRVVVLTGFGSIASAVEAVKLGATNYLCKPVDADTILATLRGEERETSETPAAEQPLSVPRMEWEYINRMLAEHDGNVSATARALGMHRRTLQRKLAKRPVRR